ncbi:uncharacterized protein LOC122282409 [Carya illinoinensis]|uniref:uncharacterized protein LOC122282409 n=1 Tax=Carya illinoinensis TaxID=32201 RepID=UPI001C725CE3|nr:uncharacterized protein LOC122282409 [Carya illinoinensis]
MVSGENSGSSAPPLPPDQDASSSYFLHNGDTPGAQLVSQPLSDENYHTWNRSMTMALIAKNKFGFVNGTLLKPSEDNPLFNSWIRCNTMVLSWILNSLNKDIAASVIFIESAADVWKDLQERFSHSNGPRIFQLRKAIFSLSQEQLSVSAYFTHLKAL